jgi:CIC family chloride channel protein
MGSALGNALAKIINNIGLGFQVSESNFTLIGMTGLMAGVLHAPLTAIFLIAEITGGYDLFVPLMLVSAISFAITRYFISNSIYTIELAERGELLTHDKDQNAMLLMNLDHIIENDFIKVLPEMKLGTVLKNAVAKSDRNIFPVVNEQNQFLGILLLDDIRKIMFDQQFYNVISVNDLMENAPTIIFYRDDRMQDIMKKFEVSGAWNLPVIKDGEYFGFISKSKMLTVYRKKLLEVSS